MDIARDMISYMNIVLISRHKIRKDGLIKSVKKFKFNFVRCLILELQDLL